MGSQLLIDADGNFLGSVSGGCVEAEVIDQAADVIATGTPKALEFGVEDETAWKVGLACGGTIRVFVEPLDATGAPDGRAASARRAMSERAAMWRWSPILPPARGALPIRRAIWARISRRRWTKRSAATRAWRSRAATARSSSTCSIPTTRLIIVGAVHVAQPLVPMARALGYEVMIVDPRSAFATEERFGDVKIFARLARRGAAQDRRSTAARPLIALTHDPKIDDPALIYALASDAFYVGALGSKKTHAKRVERLLKAGVDPARPSSASMPRSASISARKAPPRSRSPSSPRSPPCSAARARD